MDTYKQTSTEPIPTGDVTVKMQFEIDEPSPGSGDMVTLWANDWGFGAGGLTALAGLAGFAEARIDATPTIDGHPRVLGALVRPGA